MFVRLEIYCFTIMKSRETNKHRLKRPYPLSFFLTTKPSGSTLYDACESNEVELGPVSIGGPSEIVHSENWTEPVFGAGPTSGYDHVVVTGPGVDTAAPITDAGEYFYCMV